MTQVNPPYLVRKLRPISQLTPEMNNYLSQLERIIEQLYLRSGGTSETAVSDGSPDDLLGRIALVEELIEDNPFTIDSTGWTVDTTAITIDMSRA